MTKHCRTLESGVHSCWAPTCVIGIALVLELKCPGPVWVLIPEMCGHEGPVLVALLAGVIWAGGEETQE